MFFSQKIAPIFLGISMGIFPIALVNNSEQKQSQNNIQTINVKDVDTSLNIIKMTPLPLKQSIEYEILNTNASADYFVTVYNETMTPIVFHEEADGEVVLENLDPNLVYKDYKISLIEEIGGKPSVKGMTTIPDFQVLNDQYITSLEIEKTESKEDGIYVLYEIQSNIDPSKLMVQILDENEAIVTANTEDKLNGEIIIPNDIKNKSNDAQYSLKVSAMDDPTINQQTQIFLKEANNNRLFWLILISIFSLLLIFIILISIASLIHKKQKKINSINS